MNKELIELEINKANINEKEALIDLLKEGNLYRWLPENETFENFYTVKNKNELIACFAVDCKNETGILKSVAVKKNMRGKGIGKKIVDLLPNVCKKLNMKKLFAASSESPAFWRKTSFKEIKFENINDPYLLEYIEFTKKKVPGIVSNYFLLDI